MPRKSPAAALELQRIADGKPRNIIFILTDDHRYDALGFLSKAGFPETPNFDRLARDGARLGAGAEGPGDAVGHWQNMAAGRELG